MFPSHCLLQEKYTVQIYFRLSRIVCCLIEYFLQNGPNVTGMGSTPMHLNVTHCSVCKRGAINYHCV